MSYFHEICLLCLATGQKKFIEPGTGQHADTSMPQRGAVVPLIGHEAQPISFRDERAQLAMLAAALLAIREAAPSAVTVDLTTSDQDRYGFVLSGVQDAAGTELLPSDWLDTEHPLGTLDEDIADLINDLEWDGVVGENYGGYATIEIDEFLANFANRVPEIGGQPLEIASGVSQLAAKLP